MKQATFASVVSDEKGKVKTTALRCRPFTWRFLLTFLPALSREPYKSRGFVVSTIPLLINWS
jgi:hypothetical protein